MRFLPPRRGRSRQVRHAFTFVELIVVLTVLVLLIAVMLPARIKATRAASASQCFGNLQQVGVALRMYADDHRGLVPHGADFGMPQYKGTLPQAPFWGWMERLWAAGYVTHESRRPEAAQGGREGVHFPSMESGIFKCPSVESKPAGTDGAHDYTFSYGMSGEASPVSQLKRGELYHRPAVWIEWSYLVPNRIVIAESSASEPVLFYPSKQAQTRHSGGANYLFADGSVAYSTEYHDAHNSGTASQKAMHRSHWDHGNLMLKY